MPILDSALTRAARKLLLDRARALKSIEFGQEVETRFTLAQIRNETPRTGIGTWLTREVWQYPSNQPSIYMITAGDAATATAITQAFPPSDARDFNGPQSNSEHYGSLTLYVGSSLNPQQRLRQHLWQVYYRTYAMHLHRWCPAGDGEIKVAIQPILYQEGLNTESRKVIRQDLEDALWSQRRPVFGKRGGR